MLRIFTWKLSFSENLRVLVLIPEDFSTCTEELELWHRRESWSKAVGNVLMNGIQKIMLWLILFLERHFLVISTIYYCALVPTCWHCMSQVALLDPEVFVFIHFDILCLSCFNLCVWLHFLAICPLYCEEHMSFLLLLFLSKHIANSVFQATIELLLLQCNENSDMFMLLECFAIDWQYNLFLFTDTISTPCNWSTVDVVMHLLRHLRPHRVKAVFKQTTKNTCEHTFLMDYFQHPHSIFHCLPCHYGNTYWLCDKS